MIYGETWFADTLAPSYHLEHSVKFSICQDETLNQCQEFASDHYTIFKNADGKLETDSQHVLIVSIAAVKDSFQACTPNPAELDETLKLKKHA